MTKYLTPYKYESGAGEMLHQKKAAHWHGFFDFPNESASRSG
jgi:hypothetical protein